jgi:pyruvate/2-oxoglutarate dehydrogenase complex dihydrolipoamide dehydrogenase (E3) component
LNYNTEAISKKENENKGGSINDDSNSEIIHILAKNTSSGKYFKIISVQLLLVAVGRIPNSNNFGLKKIGVRVNENGFIITDEYLETIVKGIFALEDARGRYQSKQMQTWRLNML